MPCTLQHAQINAPGAYCVTVLVGHHAGQLMQVSEIVDCPCSQQLRQRHPSQRRMFPPPDQISRLQVQLLQRRQILFSQTGELVKKLI